MKKELERFTKMRRTKIWFERNDTELKKTEIEDDESRKRRALKTKLKIIF